MTSPDIQVYRMDHMDDVSVEQALSIYVRAFHGDAFVTACSGGQHEYFVRLLYAIILATYRGGEVYFARYKEQKIAGVAAWFPPGHELFHSPDQGVGGFDDLFADFQPTLRDWWTNYFFPKFNNQTTTALGEGVKLASWHLQLIGVSPDFQKHGIGKALIDFIGNKAKVDGVSLCVEVEEGSKVSFYEKCGFTKKELVEEYINPVKPLTIYVMEKQVS